ncbi:MAG TPA: SDR family NAD(P)-dependent oxidoreductase [Gemmatimonadaceae bacterium]|nr:SDR family NAD(P)-dependent oxidoreductase [Gemmatimonadaceae bacterium]
MRSSYTPIAIIGMGCRFPKAPNVGAYWRMMLDGVDGIVEVPANRWDVDMFYDPRPATPCKVVTRCGGFLEEIDRFDPYFFGISPREAIRMDPQQRLLLEVTWEAMENAGLPRERFMGSHTGTFIGVCTDDYITLERGDLANIDIYLGTGGARGSTAGRLAYLYGLSGPTAAVDTACSSSLVAVHQACYSLLQGDCDMALAGGVNVVLHPGTAIAFSQANMLSPDGRCKAFDSRANGFVRSEGAGVVLLKPLGAALEDGDPVYAVIRATASNNDGSSSPFMTPSRSGQAELLRQAYDRAGVPTESVQYVEAHGTGTAVGDPIEMGALSDVLGAGRSIVRPCIVGSSKTNIGHTEAAAGVAGLIKAVLCLHRKTIPPNLHFITPNPNIPWDELPFRVATETMPWPEHDGPARAGVNSFGISGTNAHAVLEEAPPRSESRSSAARNRRSAEPSPHERCGERDGSAELLLLSAHTAESLEAIAASYRDRTRDAESEASLRDICYSAAVHRTHHEYRVGFVSRSRAELGEKLDAFLAGEPQPGIVKGEASVGGGMRPIFVFSGIGTQWPGMGRRLRALYPAFREELERCDAAIRAMKGWSVIEEIDRAAPHSRLDQIDIMQPAIFSVQAALVALWRSWGVEPAAIVGHSLGEIAAAYTAGALSLEDAALVVCERSRLMHRASGLGRMAAVGLPAEEIARRLEPYDGRIAIATNNSPASCAISGDTDAVEELARALEVEGIFCRVLRVEVACHSHHMEPLQAELVAALSRITPRAENVPLYSAVLARRMSGTEAGAEYWGRNLRQPVLFAGAMSALLADGGRAFLELSPNPALVTPIRQNAQHRNDSVVAAASLRANSNERDSLLETAGQLFASGASCEWKRLYPEGRFVPPPPYVWQRERFWFHEAGANVFTMPGTLPKDSRRSSHPLLPLHWERADAPGTHCFESELDMASLPWLADHRVEGMALLPAAAYVEMALAASMEIAGPGPRTLRDVQLHKALFLTPDEPSRIQLVMGPEGGSARRVAAGIGGDPARASSLHFHFYSRDGSSHGDAAHRESGWTLLVSGRIESRAADAEGPPSTAQIFSHDDLDAAYPVQKTGDQFYSDIDTGMEFGPSFRSVQLVWGLEKSAVTLTELPAPTKADARHYRIHPALLDACFHSLNAPPARTNRLSLPFAIDTLEIHSLPNPNEPHWCDIRMSSIEGGASSELAMFDGRGRCVMRGTGYRSRFIEHEVKGDSEVEGWLYEQHWRETPRADPSAGPNASVADNWLIVGEPDGVATDVRAALEGAGHGTLLIPARTSTDHTADHDLAASLRRFMELGRCRGIIYLGGVDAAACVVSPAAVASSVARSGSAPASASIAERVERSCRPLLELVQECARQRWSEVPRLFVVTRHARDVGVERSPSELAQAPLVGLARVAAVELRELRVTQIDAAEDTSVERLVDEIMHADAESEVALRGGSRYAIRMARLDTEDRARTLTVRVTSEGKESFRLESSGSGVFDDLALRRIPRRPPGPGEVEVRVAAVGLNFLDVLKALNMAPGLPADAGYFGMECSGRIVAVGEGVNGLAVGDEVIALDTTASGCFRAFLTTSAAAVFPKPARLGVEEAATIPIAYQTAWYSLCELGRLREGESVLIHSAAGGVGLAALHIARERGAVIFATAGTAEKREYLKRMGASYVMSSRTLDFAREVMEYTNGRGVDLVLNSLAGDAIAKSLGVLATGGRFIEIGKRDIYADSQIGLLPFQRNLSFFAVDLLRMRMEKPEVVERLTREIVKRIADGSFEPLPFTKFPASEVADAFRYMAQGKHIGKIIVTLDESEVKVRDVPQPVRIRDDATYLVTGGLGALGLAFARRLVDQGARHLALLGRRAPTAAAAEVIDELRARGAEITVAACDVSDARRLSSVLAELRASAPPLAGVLHAAGSTQDGTLQQLRWESFPPVLASKVAGSLNLHEELRGDDLDFFVMFSSAASVLGGAGQANYAAANSFLDALAHHRERAGLPALAVNWGPWADIGMAAQDDIRGGRLAERGLGSIPVREGTELLDLLLQQRPSQIAVMPIDWRLWAERFPETLKVPFLSELSGEWAGEEATRAAEDGIRQTVLACESRQSAMELLGKHLRTDAARILRIPEERLDPKLSLIRFGLDSLMAVELKNRVESDFDVRLPAARLLQGPSVIELAEWLESELRSGGPALADGARETAPADADVSVDELSDAEVDALLRQVMTDGGGA